MQRQTPSPQAQAEAVATIMQDSKEMKEGQTWCFVNRKWFVQWVNHTQSESFWEAKPDEKADRRAPGEVDNESLLRTIEGKFPVVEIKRDFQIVRDYFCVPLGVWELFEAWYGGGPKIARVARMHGSDRVVPEIKVVKYPLTLVLVNTDKDGKPDYGTARIRKFAQVDTFKEVKKVAIVLEEEEKIRSGLGQMEVDPENVEGENGTKHGAQNGVADNGANGDATPNGVNGVNGVNGEQDTNTADEKGMLRVWFPLAVEKTSAVGEDLEGVAALEHDENQQESERFQKLEPAQEDMELGQFGFSPGAVVILLEKRVDGKWARGIENDESTKDWRDFKVEDKVDALDTVNHWLPAIVKEIKSTERQVLIHYVAYESKWDEWLDMDSDRLAKDGTKAKAGSSSYGGYSSSYNYNSYSEGTEGTPSVSGVVGLRNLGNTCFMNSTLQCMSQTPWLSQFFIDKEHLSMINRDNPLGRKGRVAEEYGSLIGKIWSDKYTVVAPSNFKQAIGEFAPQFSGYNQQDSQELLSFLVDGIHEDLNRLKTKEFDPNPLESDGKSDKILAQLTWAKHKKRHDSVILDHMGGMFRSKVVCSECKKESRKFDPFMLTIPVPLPTSDTKSQEVTVVFADPSAAPTRYAVESTKSATIEEYKEQVAKMAKVDAKSLVLAEVFSSKIYKQFKDSDSLSMIMERDVIYAFECPEINEIKEWVSIPIHQMNKSSYSSYDGREFGTPRLVVVPREEEVDSKETLKRIHKILVPFIATRGTDAEGKETKGTPYAVHFKPGWNEDTVNLDDLEKKTLDLTQRDICFTAHWGDESKTEESYKKEMIVDDSSLGKETGGSQGGGIQLSECLKAFTKEEKLKEGNEFYCRNCKKHQRVNKKMDLWKLPDILAIQLKRFQYTRAWRDKIDSFVDFPLEGLDLSDITLSEDDKKNAVYDLYAVSCHGGGLGGGHYWAYVKNRKDGKWYNMNDSSTSAMNTSSVKTSEAYLLFYARRGFPDTGKAEES